MFPALSGSDQAQCISVHTQYTHSFHSGVCWISLMSMSWCIQGLGRFLMYMTGCNYICNELCPLHTKENNSNNTRYFVLTNNMHKSKQTANYKTVPSVKRVAYNHFQTSWFFFRESKVTQNKTELQLDLHHLPPLPCLLTLMIFYTGVSGN